MKRTFPKRAPRPKPNSIPDTDAPLIEAGENARIAADLAAAFATWLLIEARDAYSDGIWAIEIGRSTSGPMARIGKSADTIADLWRVALKLAKRYQDDPFVTEAAARINEAHQRALSWAEDLHRRQA